MEKLCNYDPRQACTVECHEFCVRDQRIRLVFFLEKYENCFQLLVNESTYFKERVQLPFLYTTYTSY